MSSCYKEALPHASAYPRVWCSYEQTVTRRTLAGVYYQRPYQGPIALVVVPTTTMKGAAMSSTHVRLSRDLRWMFGITEEDGRMMRQPAVFRRVRQQVHRALHDDAALLTMVNELKRALRGLAMDGDQRGAMRSCRFVITDSLLQLVITISDQMYHDWLEKLRLAANSPAFQDVVIRYPDSNNLCEEPERYLTRGDHDRFRPQWGPCDAPAFDVISRVINAESTEDLVKLLDACLAGWWRLAEYDEVIIRAKDVLRESAA